MVAVPGGVAQLQARVMECVPGKPLTRDQLLLLARDNVVAPEAAGLAALGIAPLAVEQVVPEYLARYRPGGKPFATYAAL
jgi:NADH dehydrogenase